MLVNPKIFLRASECYWYDPVKIREGSLKILVPGVILESSVRFWRESGVCGAFLECPVSQSAVQDTQCHDQHMASQARDAKRIT